MRRACILGVFRSGSNYLRALLENNFDCCIGYNTFGWKHGPFPIVASASAIKMPKTAAVIITKNPFSSIASLFKYCRTNGRNLHCADVSNMSSFLRVPLIIRDDANPHSAELYFSSVVDYWAAMNWNLISIVGRRPLSFHVRYEDLVMAPEPESVRLGTAMAFERKSSDFFVPNFRMRNLPGRAVDWSTEETTSGKIFQADLIRAHDYMRLYSSRDRSFIMSRLPDNLIEVTGYTKLLESLIEND